MSDVKNNKKNILDEKFFKGTIYPFHAEFLGEIKTLYAFELLLPFYVSICKGDGLTLKTDDSCCSFILGINNLRLIYL